jgi:hypothetical protein
MTRQPTDSELVRQLIACVECDDEQGLELQGLLLVHGPRVAAVLGTTLPELGHRLQQPQQRRLDDVRRLIRTAQEQREAIRAEQRRNLAIAAGIMLAGLARWTETRVELDARIVLGNLLVDASKKAVHFDVERGPSITISRAKLSEASRALKFPDLRCFVDARGLHFRWRDGVGGLDLHTQDRAWNDNGVLTVALSRPQRRPKRQPQLEVVQNRPSWIGNVFADLGFL